VLAPVVAQLSLPDVGLPPGRTARAARAQGASAVPEPVAVSQMDAAAIDPSGVQSVRIAVAREAGRRCRPIVGRRVSRTRRACVARGFRFATMRAIPEIVGRLPEGVYRVWVRATDTVGNQSKGSLLRIAV
jgi:hypothetical protein